MSLKPDDEVKLFNYLNNLHSGKGERFAMWKIEPDGSLVFINDGPTDGNFSKEKNEAITQLEKSVLSPDLKVRVIDALVGFAGQSRVVGVAVRDPALVAEIIASIKIVPKKTVNPETEKKLLQ